MIICHKCQFLKLIWLFKSKMGGSWGLGVDKLYFFQFYTLIIYIYIYIYIFFFFFLISDIYIYVTEKNIR
jgi:hypothetical protein